MQLSYPKAKPQVHHAALSMRILAFCVDALLLLLFIGLIEYFTVSSDEEALLFKTERLLHLLMGWLYFAGAESSGKQATIGKHILGLQVTSLENHRISFRCASIRYVLRPVSLFVLIMQALSGNSKPSPLFHDKIARTQVVEE